jgi:hypothetical protein
MNANEDEHEKERANRATSSFILVIWIAEGEKRHFIDIEV